jgi:hypothetical protein
LFLLFEPILDALDQFCTSISPGDFAHVGIAWNYSQTDAMPCLLWALISITAAAPIQVQQANGLAHIFSARPAPAPANGHQKGTEKPGGMILQLGIAGGELVVLVVALPG